MRAAIFLSERTGHASAEDTADMLDLLGAYGPVPALDGINPTALRARLAHDKKAVLGAVHFVLPVRIGEVKIVSGVPERTVLDAIQSALA
jgi:3-dehydroquinate synthase